MRTESSPFSVFFRIAARALIVAIAGAAFLVAGAPAPTLAKSRPPAKEKTSAKPAAQEEAPDQANEKPGKNGKRQDSKKKDPKDSKNDKAAAKPEQLGAYGDWGAYAAAQGKDKTCYALGQPKERQPKAKLKDASAYVFISTRPAENVKNEVAINLGYPTKDGSGASADIDGDGFELVTKGTNAWVKNQAEEPKFVKALKEGSKLIVKAASAKGTSTTDLYSLKGLSDALGRVQQECR